MASKKSKPVEPAKEPETIEEVAEEQQTEEQPAVVTMTQEELTTVKKHIDELQKKYEDTIALLQRNQADFDNLNGTPRSARTATKRAGATASKRFCRCWTISTASRRAIRVRTAGQTA